jgi:hypothetical protein
MILKCDLCDNVVRGFGIGIMYYDAETKIPVPYDFSGEEFAVCDECSGEEPNVDYTTAEGWEIVKAYQQVIINKYLAKKALTTA